MTTDKAECIALHTIVDSPKKEKTIGPTSVNNFRSFYDNVFYKE